VQEESKCAIDARAGDAKGTAGRVGVRGALGERRIGERACACARRAHDPLGPRGVLGGCRADVQSMVLQGNKVATGHGESRRRGLWDGGTRGQRRARSSRALAAGTGIVGGRMGWHLLCGREAERRVATVLPQRCRAALTVLYSGVGFYVTWPLV
jgi:hypothetical protein